MSQSAAEQTTDETSSPRTAHRWWSLVFIGMAQLMVILDSSIVNIALPSAQRDLGFSDGSRQWVVTAYSLAFGSLLLLGGRIADLFGRKTTFLVGLVGFAAASALGGAAPTFGVLVAARAGQGAFGALLAPSALSLLSTTFTDGRERATAFSVYGAIGGAGGAVGLLLGGALTEYLTWRWTLYVNVVFAVVAFIGGSMLLARTGRDRSSALDIPGTVMVAAALFCVVYGFADAESHGWSSPQTWPFLAVGAVLLAGFVWWQTRARHPLLPLRVLADRNRGASFIARLINSGAMFGVFVFLTYYLQQVLKYSPVATGLAHLPMVVSLSVGSMFAGNRLAFRFGPKLVVPTGMGLAAAGLAWMTTLGVGSSYASQVMPQLIVTGFGMGLVLGPATMLAVSGVEARDSGVASATVNTMQQVGGSIGTALLNTFAAGATADYLAGKNTEDPQVITRAALEGYSTAYWWSALFFTVGLVVVALLYRRHVPARDKGAGSAVDG